MMDEGMRLKTALMFLEMAFEPDAPIASKDDLIWAAHSYIQSVSNDTQPSDEAQALLAKVKATVAIEDAMRRQG